MGLRPMPHPTEWVFQTHFTPFGRPVGARSLVQLSTIETLLQELRTLIAGSTRSLLQGGPTGAPKGLKRVRRTRSVGRGMGQSPIMARRQSGWLGEPPHRSGQGELSRQQLGDPGGQLVWS